MDFLVSRENSFAREDRITKPESQNTGMETTKPVRPRTTSARLMPTSFRMDRAIRLAAPLFSRKMPMIQPKPITMPMEAMVPPKPEVTVEIAVPSRLPLSATPARLLPERTAMRIAEIMSAGKACILVQMMRTIITTTPISIANTGFIDLLLSKFQRGQFSGAGRHRSRGRKYFA